MASTVSNRALTQYSGDTPSDLFIRDVPYWFDKIKRTDTPLLRLISKGSAPSTPMLKLEWGWSSPDTDFDQLNGSLDASQTSVTVDDASKFQVGSVFQIEDEIFRATAINESSNVITVETRPFGGSAATHADNLTVTILSPAIKENQSTPLSPITQGEVDYNYFQQTEYSIQLSHRAKVVPTYETLKQSGDRASVEMKKKMSETAPVQMENTILYGVRNLGSTSAASSMGGLLYTTSYITTRNTSLSGALTPLTLLDNIQTVHNLVGDNIGRTIMAHPVVCRIISSFFNDGRRLTGDATSISLGIMEIDTGWFGTFKLVPNYKMQKSGTNAQAALDKLVLFNPDDLKLVPLSGDSGWKLAPLPEDGWFTKMALRGDMTLLAQNPDSRLILGGFSVTTTDYPGLF